MDSIEDERAGSNRNFGSHRNTSLPTEMKWKQWKVKLTWTLVNNFWASEFFSRQLNALRFSLKTSWLNPAAKYKFALYGLMTRSRATDSFQSSIFILSVFVNIRMSLGNMTIFGSALGMPMEEKEESVIVYFIPLISTFLHTYAQSSPLPHFTSELYQVQIVHFKLNLKWCSDQPS